LDSFLVFAAAHLALVFFRVVPRPLGRGILNLLAFLAFYLDARHRRIADINLQVAFPEMSRLQRFRIARRSFQITAQNLLEVSRLPGLTKDSIPALVEYDHHSGWNNFEAAKARMKPILYLTGHFSAWELLPAAHALYGNPLSFVTRPLDNSRLERCLFRARQASGNTVISKKNSVRQILETLKASGSVGILMDQNTDPQEGMFADFFGLPAATTTGVALFALRTDATVLPGYLTPMRAGRYFIKFLPPLELVRTGDRNRDVEENTRLFNRVLEDIIRDQPESWLWGHKRWHYQPDGYPQDIYRLSDSDLGALLRSKGRRAGVDASEISPREVNG
jgi:KDO2-lipid IV(A) lauroyltransferase